MRLDPAEVPELPLLAALVDASGAEMARTPEWTGPLPGTVSFRAGDGALLVAPDVPTPHLDAAMAALLEELNAAETAVTGEARTRLQVLRAGLDLVAGRPPAGSATAAEVMDLARTVIPARTHGLRVSVVPAPEMTVPAPAALALALT
ncbi:MAG: hypothetical protein M3024_00235, partial [Candidatus Dormibacteraeota bacterium]|nr:hypothetical protein [Candidatus Dormibacteraeota bacterium]